MVWRGAMGRNAAADPRWHLPPISPPEIVAAVILMAMLVIVGLYPSIMLRHDHSRTWNCSCKG